MLAPFWQVTMGIEGLFIKAVSEKHRNRGKALFAKSLQATKKEGIHKVVLVVFKTNQDSNAFWEVPGFSHRDDLYYRNLRISE